MGQLHLLNFVARVTASIPLPSGIILALDCSDVGLKSRNFVFCPFSQELLERNSQCFHFGRCCRFCHKIFGEKLRVNWGSEQGIFISNYLVRVQNKRRCRPFPQKLLRQMIDTSTWAHNKGKCSKIAGEKIQCFDFGFKTGGKAVHVL